jgi:2-keto-3-deoxy-6-phosphogluconate aldolase
VITVGGSWMVPADALERQDWARIAGMARQCLALDQ